MQATTEGEKRRCKDDEKHAKHIVYRLWDGQEDTAGDKKFTKTMNCWFQLVSERRSQKSLQNIKF